MNADQLSVERRDRAMKLLQDPALLWRIGEGIRSQGVAGEKGKGLTSYIVGVSCLTDDPLALTAKGSSSIGKSWVAEKAVALIPEENVHMVSRLSKNALFYLEPDELKNKVLVIVERGGEEDGGGSVRRHISEHGLAGDVTTKDPKTNEPVTKHKEVKGPTAVVTTTTQARLAVDDETRNLSIFMDDSEEQTKAVLKMQAAKYHRRPTAKPDLSPFQDAVRILRDTLGGHIGVDIPYSDFLAEKFPTKDVRARRDFSKLLRFIAIVAFLHRYQRLRNEDGYIVALPEDYGYAWAILGDSLRRTLFGMPPKTEKLLKAARDLIKERAWNAEKSSLDGEFRTDFTRSDLAKQLRWTTDDVRNWIEPLEGTYLDVLEGGPGKAYKYHLADVDLQAKLDLPNIEDVRNSGTTPAREGTTGVSTGLNGNSVTPYGEGRGLINDDVEKGVPKHVCYFDPQTDGFPQCQECGKI